MMRYDRRKTKGRWTDWNVTSPKIELRIGGEIVAAIQRVNKDGYHWTIFADPIIEGESHGIYAAQRHVRKVMREKGLT